VWAECVFVDPIADIAVLGIVDGQVLWDEAEAWGALVDEGQGLTIAADLAEETTVWLLSLDGQWRKARAQHRKPSGGIWLSDGAALEAGMSGSPIVSADGRAAGVFSLSAGGLSKKHTGGGPQARLGAHLPGWLLRG
jgi:hypothetical protein